jgi:hypothetical protein
LQKDQPLSGYRGENILATCELGPRVGPPIPPRVSIILPLRIIASAAAPASGYGTVPQNRQAAGHAYEGR